MTEIGMLYDRLSRIENKVLRRSLFVVTVDIVAIVCLLIGWMFAPAIDEIMAHIPYLQ